MFKQLRKKYFTQQITFYKSVEIKKTLIDRMDVFL